MIWTLFKIEEMPERLLESSYSITPSTICVGVNWGQKPLPCAVSQATKPYNLAS